MKESIFCLSLSVLLFACSETEDEQVLPATSTPTFALDRDYYYERNDTIRFVNVEVVEEEELVVIVSDNNFSFGSNDGMVLGLREDEQGYYLLSRELTLGVKYIKLFYNERRTIVGDAYVYEKNAVSEKIRFEIGLPKLTLKSSSTPLYQSAYFESNDLIVLGGERLLNFEWSYQLNYAFSLGDDYPFEVMTITNDEVVLRFEKSTGFGVFTSNVLFLHSSRGEDKQAVASLNFKPTGIIENHEVTLNAFGRRRLLVSLPANVVGTQNVLLKLDGKPVDDPVLVSPTGDGKHRRTLVHWNIPTDWLTGEYEAKVTINIVNQDHEVHLINTSTVNILE